jgi:integrase
MAERGRGQVIECGKDKWYVKIFRGRDSNGKRLYHRKVITGNRSAAQKYLTAKLREKDLGIVIVTSRQSLNDHLDIWLKMIHMRVAVQTYNSYESLLRVHVRPNLGCIRLSELKIHDIQSLYSEMLTHGSSANTIQHVHAVLSMSLKKAVELDLIVKNPCDFAELPRQTREETKAFSSDQARMFLEKANSSKHGLIFEFAMISGMRPEEYLSLTWSDVDFARGSAVVRRALVWLKGGGYEFGEPKTRKSRRTVSIPHDLMLKLKDHRRRQLEHRMKFGVDYTNLDLVFASDIGTPLNYRNLTLRHYNKILEKAGLEGGGFVLYSLRHTCATLLLAAGENPKKVADRLGHSSVRTTLDTYSHVLPELERSAADKLGDMLYYSASS